MRQFHNRRGFTLIEIMVVIVILALLAALVGPKIMGRTDDAKIQTTKTQIRSLESALKLYKLDNGVYPTTEQGLNALVTMPTVGVIPKGYKEGGYLESKSVPKDGWGNDFSMFRLASTGITISTPMAPTASRGVKGKTPISTVGI